MTDTSSQLRKTPLHARHRASHARLVPFAGWDMPVEYSGITDEHMAVRTRAGLFDVSHMGQIEVAGPDALAVVQRVASNDASRLASGQAQYSALLSEEGTFIDDMLVMKLASTHFMLVVNAANVARDYAWIAGQIVASGARAAAVDTSSRYAVIAVQGPAAADVLQPLTGVDLGELRPYWFAHGEVANARATVSRTGYTGEDGFEIFVPPNMADRVWLALLDAGSAVDIRPCGLGARDTLRLEAGMRLHGSDIDETTSVLEAGLGWIVGWNKTGFLGEARLRAQKAQGVERRLVGFEMLDRGIARHGYPVLASTASAGPASASTSSASTSSANTAPIGIVTSGTQTPFLKKAIGMAYVPAALAAPGQALAIDVRGRSLAARIVPMPFYKRPSA